MKQECFGDYGNWKCEICPFGEKCIYETICRKVMLDDERKVD
jgi:hypothetical protein